VAIGVRSHLFNILFYLTLLLYLIIALPTLAMPRWGILAIAKAWARSSLWLLKAVCGIDAEFRGLEKVPRGALLVVSKHQSLWETFALLLLFPDPAFIAKRELMWIPLFGWYIWRADMIWVDRGARSQALSAITQRAREEFARGRQLIIFPEGTRRAPGAEPVYKYGAVHLYAETGVTCLPLALNSGLFWPRRSFRRFPGTVRVEILDPIPPGLDKESFAQRLRNDIEGATARLVAEGERELGLAGTPAAAAGVR
jgi:1-acyl-sn-glycerol-3-phosphate acyltransferase